jgi:hypothetical protein
MSSRSSARRSLFVAATLGSAAFAVATGGCASGSSVPGAHRPSPASSGRLPASYQPRQLGLGPAFRPGPLGAAARAARPVPALGARPPLRCGPESASRFGAHVELFVNGRVVGVPAGIGIAPPQRRDGARVTGGRCSYPLRTTEPTGVIEVSAGGARPLLGDLFAVWGQPLSQRRLAGFRAGRGGVRAYVDGRRFADDPRRLALSPHAQIVLEVGGLVAPHPVYRFPPGS